MVESWKIFEYLLPKLAALFSLFGSSMIVAEVYQDWKTKRYSRDGLNAISRALLSMSIGDIFFSFAWFMASWVVSQSEQGVESFEASQTSGACKFQGFLVQFGFFASISFNASLAVIYLLMVRYHWSNQQITRRFNCVAAVIWMLALALAIFPLALNLYHDIGENCWLSAPPSDLPQCQEEESFYAHPECIERTDITNLLMGMQILPVWICIVLNARIMYVIYRETRKLEVTTREEVVRTQQDEPKGKDEQANPDEKETSPETPEQQSTPTALRPSWRRRPDEEVEPLAMPFDEMGRPILQPPAAAAPAPAITPPQTAAAEPEPTKPRGRGSGKFSLLMGKKATKAPENMPTAKSFFGWKSSTNEDSVLEAGKDIGVAVTPSEPLQSTSRREVGQNQTEIEQPQLPAKESITFAQMEEGSDSLQEEAQTAADSTMNQSAMSQGSRRSRTVAVQGLWYIGGFFFTYLPGTLSILVFLIAGEWSTPLYRASLTFLALQGAWNFVVFCKGRREMKTWIGGKVKMLLWDKVCYCQCVPKSVLPPSPGVSYITPPTSRISKKKESEDSTGQARQPFRAKGSSRNSNRSNPMVLSDASTEVHANRKSLTFTSVLSNASTVVHANLPPTTTTLVSIAEDMSASGDHGPAESKDIALSGLESTAEEPEELGNKNLIGLSEASVCSVNGSNSLSSTTEEPDDLGNKNMIGLSEASVCSGNRSASTGEGGDSDGCGDAAVESHDHA